MMRRESNDFRIPVSCEMVLSCLKYLLSFLLRCPIMMMTYSVWLVTILFIFCQWSDHCLLTDFLSFSLDKLPPLTANWFISSRLALFYFYCCRRRRHSLVFPCPERVRVCSCPVSVVCCPVSLLLLLSSVWMCVCNMIYMLRATGHDLCCALALSTAAVTGH